MAAIRTANLVFALLLLPVSAWGWENDGHEIVAVIAADNLTPAAQSHVTNILGVSADQTANAMEAASIRPDWDFRKEDLERACGSKRCDARGEFRAEPGSFIEGRRRPNHRQSALQNLRVAWMRNLRQDGARESCRVSEPSGCGPGGVPDCSELSLTDGAFRDSSATRWFSGRGARHRSKRRWLELAVHRSGDYNGFVLS